MKKVALMVALAISVNAQAATCEMPNNAGGVIVLTERRNAQCDKNQFRVAYGTHRNGNVLFGCWTMIDDRIWVDLADQVSVFDPTEFRCKGQAKQGTKRYD